MSLLANKPPRWDAADASPAEIRDIIEKTLAGPPAFEGRRPFRILDWNTSLFMSVPKPVSWLVNEVMPLGAAGMLAAAGGTGKGMLILDLALKVTAMPATDGRIDVRPPLAFGCTVAAHGHVIILSAEDNQDEIHRRIAGMDPGQVRRKASGDRLHVIPMPNAGGVSPLVVSARNGMETTPFYDEFKRQACEIDDLKLIVIDPLASFIHADINADPQAAAYCMGVLAELAEVTGAFVLVAHHMGKGDQKRPVSSPEEARAMVRGTTGLVDGLRMTYAIWPADESRARDKFRLLGAEFKRNTMFLGAVVKANGKADDTVRTYMRDAKTGLLNDITTQLRNATPPADDLMDDVEDEIRRAAATLHPFTKSGKSGLYARRNEMAKHLHGVARDRFEAMADRLLEENRIAVVHPIGRGHALDVPDGPYAKGEEARTDRAARPMEEE